MSVHQVEEYYIHISGLSIDPGIKQEIEDYLDDEGFSNYEFQDDDSVLVVDNIESESEGEHVEERITQIIG